MSGKGQVWIKRNYESCSGCRRCEIACSVHHEGGRIWPEASMVRVFMLVPGIEIPHLCFQCEGYPCVEACPVEALYVNRRTGAVNVNAKCTACGLCIEACPGNVPHLHPEGSRIVICDLCDGRPECVKACMEGRWDALTSIPREQVPSRKSSAKTPGALTREVAERILGKETTREALC